MLEKRFARLSQGASQALGMASVLGATFDLHLIEAVGGLPRHELEERFEEARAARVLIPGEERGRERLVVRWHFPDRPRASSTFWLVLENGRAEVCVKSPGDDEKLIVIADSERFVRRHMGRESWRQAAGEGDIRVEGASRLARAFPSWNSRSHFAHVRPVVDATSRTRAGSSV